MGLSRPEEPHAPPARTEMPDAALTTLGKRIEWARREMMWREGREISASSLSYRIFCPEATVSQWEHGVGKPSEEELALLAHLLGVDAHWLATGEGATGIDRRRTA